MIGWLKAKRRNKHRAIFPFWDGKRDRQADPMAVYRRLVKHERFNLQTHPALVEAGDLDAMECAATATRDAFGIDGFEAGGLTDTECLDLMVEFFVWVDDVKKNISTLPTSPLPTEPEPSAISTGSSGADSPGTWSGQNYERPGGL